MMDCWADDPESRPTMREVAARLERVEAWSLNKNPKYVLCNRSRVNRRMNRRWEETLCGDAGRFPGLPVYPRFEDITIGVQTSFHERNQLATFMPTSIKIRRILTPPPKRYLEKFPVLKPVASEPRIRKRKAKKRRGLRRNEVARRKREIAYLSGTRFARPYGKGVKIGSQGELAERARGQRRQKIRRLENIIEVQMVDSQSKKMRV